MHITPHKDKLIAALKNPKCSKDDRRLLDEGLRLYEGWIARLKGVGFKGDKSVKEMVNILNWYKDEFEVNLIMKKGSPFLRRQKGQLKLDNSILEEFLVNLVNPDIVEGLKNVDSLEVGPSNAFMSLAFFPRSMKDLTDNKPNVVIKTKDQDFIIGTKIYYKFSTSKAFNRNTSSDGELVMAVLAAECKVNLDKTMFQEAAGTAARLKQGCPVARYFVLVEYLDMTPEDCRLTSIDNVFILRKTRRLPFEKRDNIKEVQLQRNQFPIDDTVVLKFVWEIQNFVNSILYDPDEAIKRGSFV